MTGASRGSVLAGEALGTLRAGGAHESASACDAKSMLSYFVPSYFVPSLKRGRSQVGGGPRTLLAHQWGWWHRGLEPHSPPQRPVWGWWQQPGLRGARGDSISPTGRAALAPDSRGGNVELIKPALWRAPCWLCHRPA